MVQKKASRLQHSPSGIRIGARKTSASNDSNGVPGSRQPAGKIILLFIEHKTKPPMDNASKNLKNFLTIEISFVCHFKRPSCNVANASVVLIPCHSGGSETVLGIAISRLLAAILPQFS